MEGSTAAAAAKDLKNDAEQAKVDRLKKLLERLLHEAAEAEVQLSRAEGAIRGVPHYSVIEGRAHELGMQLSRSVQQEQMLELTALQAPVAACPTCKTRCELTPHKRKVKSVDGDTELQELVGHCLCCRRDFFPAARSFGV